MRSLSQSRLDRKREKARAILAEKVVEWSDVPFCDFAHVPTNEQIVAMFLAARFGPGDPLMEGGEAFALEYILDEVWQQARDADGMLLKGKGTYLDPDGTALRVVSAQSEHWANLLFVIDIDIDLARYWAKLGVDDFDVVRTPAGNPDHMVERESGAFGFVVECDTLVPLLDAFAQWGDPFKFRPEFQANPYKANDKVTVYRITIGPLDRLLTPAERSTHGVAEFARTLPSGRTTSVRAHVRRNPKQLRPRETNLDEIAHVVYRAFDLDGRVRYFGEGTELRPAHVNSGASHNYKLNEHFFRRGPMRVEVFARGLSKDEARSVERLCIRGHAGPHELWNVKDYEAARPADVG